jgi:hypothetical protein
MRKPLVQKKLPGARPGKSNREVKGTSVKASSPSKLEIGAVPSPFKKIMQTKKHVRYARSAWQIIFGAAILG